MSKAVKQLTDNDFINSVNNGVALVDFWAPWCGPCKLMGPILDSVAGKIGDRAVVAKVNVDENMLSASKFGVRSIPTIVLLKNGHEVTRFVGVRDETTLVQAVEGALSN